MHVHEIQPLRRSPMAEESWLYVIQGERLTQQRIREKINLADGEIVRCAPVCIELMQRVIGERTRNRPLALRSDSGSGGHTAL